MGTNLLRFACWKLNGELPRSGIITGESNPTARMLAQREHFDKVFTRSRSKVAALSSFCEGSGVRPEQVLFFFDDVLDLEVARLSGARIMIGRPSAPLLRKFAQVSGVADYITAHDGGNHGVREGCELVMGLLGCYDDVVRNRMVFSAAYQSYFALRQEVETTTVDGI
jgi:3-deoxy-D-manno-octulosonate 8-phosphate phosphatase (KDO 8-P phosphatase)